MGKMGQGESFASRDLKLRTATSVGKALAKFSIFFHVPRADGCSFQGQDPILGQSILVPGTGFSP